jgi:hypothetical protein
LNATRQDKGGCQAEFNTRRPPQTFRSLSEVASPGAGADAITTLPADGRVATGWHVFRCGPLARAAPGVTPGLCRPCSLDSGPAACCEQAATETAEVSSCCPCSCCRWGPSARIGRALVITPCRALRMGALMSSSARWCSTPTWS